LIPSPGAGQASRAHSRGVIQRNPKAVSAAAPKPNPMPPPMPNPQVINPQQQRQLQSGENDQLPP
jgi:hypothetical protein